MSLLHQVIHSAVFMDIRLFRDETFAYHDRRTDQCHSSGDGACRGNARVWRAVEPLSMDRCAAGCCLFFHAEPFGKERRNRLQA